MKTLLSIALISLCACIQVTGQSNRETLFDFRTQTRNNPPRITAATSKKVLDAVFRKYLSDARFCREDVEMVGAEDYLGTMRQIGQIVPSIMDLATGSFTAAGENQIAYVVSVGECNASHADNFGSKRLAIFSGNKLVLNVDLDFKSGILKKTDVDANGIDELLLLGGDMNQGILIETAALVEVRNRKLAVVQDFQKVFEDSCASLIRGSGIEASVIFLGPARSGQMPAFQVENYRSGCGRTKRWRLMSKGIMSF
ncbi:MAG: hypothetical protein M3447_00340 [Acidobacteriota bacterium]|nr:hypothetical protein [Acidobacteriota bacterium]